MKQSMVRVAGMMVVLAASNAVLRAQTPVYQDPKASIEHRVDDVFGRLTLDEKIRLLGGSSFWTNDIPRLGIPEMLMADAGQGVRGGRPDNEGPATAFPAGVMMAATWSPELLRRVGQAIGEESRNKGPGAMILLGPAVNIHRAPLNGRNGEYLSEDPYLAAQLAVPYIKGMQSTGVSACVKHFACNNQEINRTDINEHVGERALREIFLPAFEAAVKDAGVWAVMSSYNKVNGKWASANDYLLTDVLKKDWKFDGVVMSDWGGVHDVATLQAGNDVEMPDAKFVTVEKVKAELSKGTITQAAVDDATRRVLRTIIRVGLLDPRVKPDPSMVNSDAHRKVAYDVAAAGIVLLKNEGNVLPLDRAAIKSIAVIGEPGRSIQVGALGSPEVKPLRTVQIIDGLKQRGAENMVARFVRASVLGEAIPASVVTVPDDLTQHGFKAEYFKNRELSGEPAVTRTDEQVWLDSPKSLPAGFSGSDFSARWTATLTPPVTGEYTITFNGDDGCRLFIGDDLVIDQWKSTQFIHTVKIMLEAGKKYRLRAEYFQIGGDIAGQLTWKLPGKQVFSEAIDAAKQSDVAVVCVSTDRTETEGYDRKSFDLPGEQAELIRVVAAANPRTIVILNNGGPVGMQGWIAGVPAVVEAFFPGQEGGAALADILFGNVNPSGKLTDTVAVRREDYSDFGNYPGKDLEVNYAEGIYVGYRHFDKAKLQPLFPFGHGLSYTTFEYSNLQHSSPPGVAGEMTVSVDVTNTGKRAGDEIVQLYVSDPSPKIDKPVRELKGFARVSLNPGEKKTAVFTLRNRDFAYFDVAGKQWKADAGEYEIEVGASSAKILQRTRIALPNTFTESVPLSKEFYVPPATK